MSGKKGDGNGNNGDGNGSNPDKTPDYNQSSLDGSSGGGWNGWGATGKVGGAAVIAVAVITGLIFLPRVMVDTAQDALFGWLPEEWRDVACSVCSLCCCCGSCCLAAVLVYMTVMK